MPAIILTRACYPGIPFMAAYLPVLGWRSMQSEYLYSLDLYLRQPVPLGIPSASGHTVDDRKYKRHSRWLEADRSDKTKYLAQFQPILDQIQVCWRSSSTNCGHCPKCSAHQYCAGHTGQALFESSRIQTHGNLQALKPTGESTLAYLDDIILFAYHHDRHDLVRKAFKRYAGDVLSSTLHTGSGQSHTGKFWQADLS